MARTGLSWACRGQRTDHTVTISGSRHHNHMRVTLFVRRLQSGLHENISKNLMPFPSIICIRTDSTCRMVSKLNVSPFHRVNSPLEAPVTRRRPSGVHWREQINRLSISTPPQPRPCPGAHAYPDHKHGTLDFIGGGSDKLCGDSVHWVVQHPQRRNKLQQAERFFRLSSGRKHKSS